MGFDQGSWEKDLQQRSQKAAEKFARLVEVIAKLRHPIEGCPWDLKQTHQSLRAYMIEEAYEAAEAMLSGDSAHMIEELGDVLLQVVLNAELASNADQGSISDVVEAITEKMIRRHPHVFDQATKEDEGSREIAAIKDNWSRIKAEEKARKGDGAAKDRFFSRSGLEAFPASTQAKKIGKLSGKIGFDWDDPLAVLGQLRSEIDELEAEMKANVSDKTRLADEMGDVLFSAYQLARHLGFDPEAVAQQGNIKFLNRFEKLEDLARSKGIDVQNSSQQVLESLWQEVKKG